MSSSVTAVATPVTPITIVPSWVTGWETLIKAHEKIIIIGVLAFTSFHFYSRAIDSWDRHDSKTAQQAAVVVKTDDSATKATQAQLKILQAQVAAQTSLIAKQITQRAQATQQQKKIDATLAPNALADRWQTILKLSNGSVTPSGVVEPGTGQPFTVTDTAALATVTALEDNDQFKSDIVALQTEHTEDQSVISKQTVLIGDLNTELTDEKKSHVADVNAEKVKAKHSFISGLKIGVVIGFVGGLFLGHAI